MSIPPYTPTNMSDDYSMPQVNGRANPNLTGMAFGEPMFGAAQANQGPLGFDEADGLPQTTMPFTGMHPSHATVPMTAGGAFPMGPGHGRNMSTGQMRDSPQYMNTTPLVHGGGHDNIECEEEQIACDETKDPNADFKKLFATPGKVMTATEIMESLRSGRVILNMQKAQAERRMRKLSDTKRNKCKPRAINNNPSAAVRRRKQNCESQRRYRMRKDTLIDELTEDVNTMSEQLASQCVVVNDQLQTIKRLKQELAASSAIPSPVTSSVVSEANGLAMMPSAPSSAHVSPASAMSQQMGLSPADGVHHDMAYDLMGGMPTNGGFFDHIPTPASLISTDSMLDMSYLGDNMPAYSSTTPGAENNFFPGGPA